MHKPYYIPTGFKAPVALPTLPAARTLSLYDVAVLSGRVAALYSTHKDKMHVTKHGSRYLHQSPIYELTITGTKPEAVFARAITYRFWKRSIEKAVNEDRLNYEASKGAIGGKRKNNLDPPIYCSDETLNRVDMKNEKNKKTLSKYIVTDLKSGKTENLWTLAQKNIENQLNQTYWVIKSMESIGIKKGFDWLFITLTAPPIYHPNPSRGKRSYDPSLGVKGSHEYINKRWVKIRSNLAHKGIPACPEQYFGLRTVEPHKDGCIHWHLIIFINPENATEFSNTVMNYFNIKEQAKIIKGDYTKGTAASYLYKYIAKGLSKKESEVNTENEETDQKRENDDLASLRHRKRVQAAIKTLSARQYQIVGLPRGLLTLVKEINKLDLDSKPQLHGSVIKTVKREIWKNRNALIYLIENPKLIEKDGQGLAPLMLYKRQKENGYGETTNAIRGVSIDGVIYSREHRFLVKKR